MAIVVSNASPLILLSGIGEFYRLRDLFGEILITPQVYEEVAVRGMGKPGSAELAGAGFIRRRGAVGIERVETLREQAQLAEGEASTIILADELKADLVLIDEKAARAAAKGWGWPSPERCAFWSFPSSASSSRICGRPTSS